MTRIMLIDATEPDETRVVTTDTNGDVDHFDFITKSKTQLKSNIYLGKVTRVEPSLQAAFVEYGAEKQGFLPFSEIHPDYYQIPVEDRKRLMEEAEEEERRAEEEAAKQEAEDENGEGKKSRGRNSTRRRGRRKNFSKNSQAAAVEDEDNLVASEEVDAVDENENADVTAEVDTDTVKVETVAELDEIEEEPAAKETQTSEEIAADTSPEPTPVDDEDDAEEARKRRTPITRRYKIQEVIKPGQIILVQVVKEERGNKGVSLSSYMSLAGRYCVLMPNSPKDGGISRKIANNEDRKRLKQISAELKESRGMSAIIRTAGIDRTRAEIKRDYEYLIKLWNQIREDALASIAPAAVYEENDIIKRSIRDHYDGDIEQIWVQGEASYKQAKAFMKMLMPSHAPRVKHYKESQPLFVAHNIEPTLNALYNVNAPLKSGGYLVINPTEALISIDVNSGRSTNERNVEETAYKTNLEAAHEVARQLRLRNLGGLVVVDFIDMNYGKHRRNVERAMRDALKGDRAKVQTSQISTFGLMELSRQRMGASLEETTTKECSACNGTGKVMLAEAIVMQLMRNLQSFAMEQEKTDITITLSAAVMQALCNNYRESLRALEDNYGITIMFSLSTKDNDDTYSFKSSNGQQFQSTDSPQRKPKGRNNRRDRNKNNRRSNNNNNNKKQQTETAEDNTKEEAVAAEDTEPKKKPTRRRRNTKNKNTDKAEEIKNESSDTQDATATENDSIEEKPKPKSTRRRKPATKAKPEPKSETEDKQKIVKAESPAIEQEATPPIKSAPAKISPAAEPTIQDTPSPKDKRKGWWQRVIDS